MRRHFKLQTLLGITFEKRLSWKRHVEKLEAELRKRIGLLRRLRMKLPLEVLKKLLDPLFNSKLRYAAELTADATNKDDPTLRRLHSLHRGAMKAILGLGRLHHPTDEELYTKTGQIPVQQIILEATASLAWKCGRDWCTNPLAQRRLENHFSGKRTRQATQRSFPPQSTRGSLLSRLIEVWEILPQNVKVEENWDTARLKIKTWTLSLMKF